MVNKKHTGIKIKLKPWNSLILNAASIPCIVAPPIKRSNLTVPITFENRIGLKARLSSAVKNNDVDNVAFVSPHMFFIRSKNFKILPNLYSILPN